MMLSSLAFLTNYYRYGRQRYDFYGHADVAAGDDFAAIQAATVRAG